MDSDRYQRMKTIFIDASALAAEDREAYLRRACGEDEDLYVEVASLLDHHGEEDDAFLKPLSRLPDILDQEEAEQKLPERIGQYRIVRLIGSGGMSSVYEAVQDYPERRVAIKVMRSVFASSSLMQRLEYEAQILASLQHPGIAQLFEAGFYEKDGAKLPYFVMEYVEQAQPVTAYAQKQGLSLRQKVVLFLRVCDAVAHGHQHGIIHRDLKPANILVDASGLPKIIDFGVARATGSDIVATQTLQTEIGQLVGTPQYMSPEQFVGNPRQIDTRSDVYSLGVVFFELLGDEPPYDVKDKTIIQAAKIVSEQPPRRLGNLKRSLRGDLETIVQKTLEKDAEKRYATAAALGQDLRCYLDDQPISARPPSAVYRGRMFVRRNKALVGGVGAVILALAVGMVATGMQAVRLEKARQEAKAEADRAKAFNTFMREMLGAVDRLNPNPPELVAGTTDLRVEQLLQRSLPRIREDFGHDPALEAEVRETVGLALRGLGEFEDSIGQFEEAYKLRSRALGPEHEETLRTQLLIGFNRSWLLQDAEAEAIYRAVLPKLERVFGPRHEHTLQCKLNLADALQWQAKFAEAEPLMQENLAALTETLGPNHPDTINSMADLCSLLRNKGQFREALELIEAVSARSRAHRGESDRVTLYLLKLKGQTHAELGDYEAASRELREAMQKYREVFGREHAWVNWVRADLAWAEAQSGEWESGEQELRDVLAEQTDRLAPDHAYTRETLRYLGFVLVHTGKYDEAVTVAGELADSSAKAVGEDHVYTQLARGTAAAAMYLRGQTKEAEPILRQTTQRIAARLGEEHPITALSQLHWGANLSRLSRFEEAEGPLLAAMQTLAARRGPGHRLTLQARGELARLYEAWGMPERAAVFAGSGGAGATTPSGSLE